MAETELGRAREDRPEPLQDLVDAVLVARFAMLDFAAALDADNKAFRQYDAIDPANRLVTTELEWRWNQALIRSASWKPASMPPIADDRLEQKPQPHHSQRWPVT